MALSWPSEEPTSNCPAWAAQEQQRDLRRNALRWPQVGGWVGIALLARESRRHGCREPQDVPSGAGAVGAVAEQRRVRALVGFRRTVSGCTGGAGGIGDRVELGGTCLTS